eukprot:SM000222S06963  [mRNA]  locus=s222:11950:18877:- [translate_table: standard]
MHQIKYSALSFLPRNLFEQFHRVAYSYFLVIAILNQIPELAVFGRTASVFPLVLVLVVTAIKDAYEDWGRHRADREENARICRVLQPGPGAGGGQSYADTPWRDVRVGHVVQLHAGERVPCDMLLLSSSAPGGLCYIETGNLDGESTLKSRRALPQTQRLVEEGDQAALAAATVVCEPPHRNIYEFLAYLELPAEAAAPAGAEQGAGSAGAAPQRLPVGPGNMILRGAEVRNTASVVAVAVYTGPDTKVVLNSSGAQSKRSRLEVLMNREIVVLACLLGVLCFIGALGMGLWLDRHDVHTLPYYGAAHSYHGKLGEAVLNFFSVLIVCQIMVPISLYISLELMRLGQAFFMSHDRHMVDGATGRGLQVRALNINEDLGQVRYVFSDKTGTLTENRMVFQACSAVGVNYCNPQLHVSNGTVTEEPSASAPDVVSLLQGEPRTATALDLGQVAAVRTAVALVSIPLELPWKPQEGALVDASLVRELQRRRPSLHHFMLALATCNTVVPTRLRRTASGEVEMEAALHEDGAELSGKDRGVVEYQGESPDEQALVTAAASYGYTLLERSPNLIVLQVFREIQRYEVLGVHEFDSTRKRMSVVVRGPDGRVLVLAKGADSAMMPLLRRDLVGKEAEAEASVLQGTLRDLDAFARQGLRTLVLAWRELSAEEEQQWVAKYQPALTALADRSGALQDAALLVERDLRLAGATGIEDKLQEGVSETIAQLRRAGLQVWLLTGDKQETAISVAYSCALLSEDMHQIVINEESAEGTRQAVAQARALLPPQPGTRHKRESRLWPLLPRFLWLGKRHQRKRKGLKLTAPVAEQSRVNGREGEHVSLHSAEDSDQRVSESAGAESRGKLPSLKIPGKELALIIDGGTLFHALTEDLEGELYEVAAACTVVLCCRVAPLQKAGLVSLVKRRTDDITLAIGDGANDVSMIQIADIGVGISGVEGRQAVLASDFAIGQFRFLRRLLLVHGHWNYYRLATMILYNFYRNAVFVLMLFWLILHTAFSPTTALGDWNLVFFSLIYTSVPTIAVGILEQDVSARILLRLPQLYRAGQRNETYNLPLFWLTMADTLWQSLVLFYVPFFTIHHSDASLWGVGQIWNLAVVFVVSLHLAMDIRLWNWIIHLVVWASLVVTVIVVIILDIIPSQPQYWSFLHMAGEPWLWLDTLLIVVMALTPRFVFQVLRLRFRPTDAQLIEEAARKAAGEVQRSGQQSNHTSLEANEVVRMLSTPRTPADGFH